MTIRARSWTLHKRAGLTIVLMLFAAGAVANAKPKTIKPPHPETLRCFDPQLTDLIQQGLARSGTLQDLVSHLESAGVIVYLSYNYQLPPGTAGRTRLMVASSGWRYLSTELSGGMSKVDLLSLLGHELQHAVEIADAPEVVDDATLTALYRRIGLDGGSRHAEGALWFETQSAIDTGRRILTELYGRW